MSKRVRTAIDVGASLGTWTLFLSKISSRVISFEPDPRARAVLLRNIYLNGLKNCLVLPYLVSSNTGTRVITLDFAGTTHISSPELFGVKRILVPAITLDEFVQNCGVSDIDFIKIDVEGHETEVLKGSLGVLKRYRPLVLVEIWHKNETSVRKLLLDLDYALVKAGANYFAVPHGKWGGDTLSGMLEQWLAARCQDELDGEKEGSPSIGA